MKKAAFIVCSLLTMFSVFAASAPAVYAQAKQQVIDGASSANATPANKVETTIERVINVISFIVGIVAVIMIIIAGIQFITAQGDSNSIARARSVIIYAGVGLVIVAIAQTIVRFIITETGV